MVYEIIPIQLCSISSPKNPLKNQGFLYCSCGIWKLAPFTSPDLARSNAKKVAVGRLGGKAFPFFGGDEKKKTPLFFGGIF